MADRVCLEWDGDRLVIKFIKTKKERIMKKEFTDGLEIVKDWNGEDGGLRLSGDKPTIRFTGGPTSSDQSWIMHLGSNGPGNLEFFNRKGPGSWGNVMSLTPSGNVEITGDIRLTNADCAEDFDIVGIEQVEPGTVMVIDSEGALRPSYRACDKRVAGVISGAGNYKPGLILDKQQDSSSNRMPIALMGKVYCKVDASYGAIEVGDLLTTSATPGHAMRTDDPMKAFGAVIGKALQPLASGEGLIPILIALQ
jgi:hypothetical protein